MADVTTKPQRPDSILAWGQTVLIVVVGLTVYELSWRWYVVAAAVAAELALLAWRRPPRTPTNPS